MARRHRCVHCKKLFGPNYRNRTKTSGRQRVCEKCGPLIGHRFADQRYRLSQAKQHRSRTGKVTKTSAHDPTVSPATAPPSTAPPESAQGRDAAVTPAMATWVRAQLIAIAARLEPSTHRPAD